MASRKILVVDDDAPTRSLLQALFEHNGHTCVQAGDGQERASKLYQARGLRMKPRRCDVAHVLFGVPEAG